MCELFPRILRLHLTPTTLPLNKYHHLQHCHPLRQFNLSDRLDSSTRGHGFLRGCQMRVVGIAGQPSPRSTAFVWMTISLDQTIEIRVDSRDLLSLVGSSLPPTSRGKKEERSLNSRLAFRVIGIPTLWSNQCSCHFALRHGIPQSGMLFVCNTISYSAPRTCLSLFRISYRYISRPLFSS